MLMRTTSNRAAGGLVLALAILTAAVGCGGPAGPERTAVHGNVTLGGAPLKAGRIVFTPQKPTEGPAVSAAIADGAYALSEEDGPVPGRHRVQVQADVDLGFPIDDDIAFAQRGGAPLPRNPVPPAYNEQSQQFVELAPDKDNEYHVVIPAAY